VNIAKLVQVSNEAPEYLFDLLFQCGVGPGKIVVEENVLVLIGQLPGIVVSILIAKSFAALGEVELKPIVLLSSSEHFPDRIVEQLVQNPLFNHSFYVVGGFFCNLRRQLSGRVEVYVLF
jgi:hypothetical protein